MPRFRVGYPPATGDVSLDHWLASVADALNGFPSFSVVSLSGTPNAGSGTTGELGELLINIGSNASKYWLNTGGNSSGWSSLDYR